MTHRYTLAAVLLAAFSIPAAAQYTTPKDTAKKTPPSGVTTVTSPGAIADTAAPTTAKPGAVSPTPGAAVTLPAPAAQPTPQKAAARVDIKVDSALANTVKISADSAFALALAQEPGGEVSSADLEMKDGKLVYEIKLLTKNKGASEVQVDAMTGAVVKDKKYGGVKAVIEHDQENKKLLDAKRDSAGTKKP